MNITPVLQLHVAYIWATSQNMVISPRSCTNKSKCAPLNLGEKTHHELGEYPGSGIQAERLCPEQKMFAVVFWEKSIREDMPLCDQLGQNVRLKGLLVAQTL